MVFILAEVSIRISKENRAKLAKQKKVGESYNQVVERLLKKK